MEVPNKATHLNEIIVLYSYVSILWQFYDTWLSYERIRIINRYCVNLVCIHKMPKPCP